ncbi:MAG: prepilin peptidase [Planctomycetota bacterium]|nr:MAG: prepilin peptidase [Planctomycetota bacterium]
MVGSWCLVAARPFHGALLSGGSRAARQALLAAAGACPLPCRSALQNRRMLPLMIGLVMGAFIGSFLGVIIHRLPQGMSIVRPPSHCGDCGTVLRWYDNVPIFGWLALRGRCRWCGARIPLSVLTVELVTALATGLICWWVFTHPAELTAPLGIVLADWVHLPWLAPVLAALALLVAMWALIVSTFTDLEHLIIPDELSKPLQLLAPFLALLLVGSMAEASYLLIFYVQSQTLADGAVVAMWTIGGGSLLIAGVVVLVCVLLLASLPFARWVYGTRIRGPFPWREEDHRAFAKGLWWFVIALQPALLLLLLSAWWSDPVEGPDLPLFLVLGLSHALLGSLVGWCLPYAVGLFGTWAFGRNAMGYGDVKMLAWMGAFLGPMGVLFTFFLAAIYGSLIGIPMRLCGGGREIPFGPYLVAGAITAFLFHGWLQDMLFAGFA